MAPVGPSTASSRQTIDRVEDGKPHPQQLRNAGEAINIARSDKQLENLKQSDAIFAARFGEDVAFREGVLSMVWLAKTRPADFDTRQQLQTSSGVASGPAEIRG